MAQTLAIKYRPQTFDDVVEQGPIKQILQDQLRTGTTKNCYLFTGGAGTGKTTCARIFASEINGHRGNPIEVDAASNNGVENVREIIDNAKFKALDAPYKVYIIDECHMLSTGAWNAMLKLLEEPPAQTVFIMCTTDPQKIPPTILSRVQRYDFQRITFEGIVGRLKYICCEENISYTDEAIEQIAKIADGGCRDSITLLDKVSSYSNEITIQSVIDALGCVPYTTMFELTTNILQGSTKNAVTLIETVHRSGMDLKQFMKQYLYFILDAYKWWLTQKFDYIQIPSTYKQKLETYTDNEYFYLRSLLDHLVKLNNEIKWETSPKALIQATIIFACEEEK